eukprot:TRINITY_DN6039_c0_g1_i1.p1 TRINITY_DN6039_c0_g1~~TRINITY_DN6039_c0_g1_i1.p1  ORF type:complete len:240 (+),score=71.10 TRINITY_DN6039_c0_g1_i1:395-1114(+)
MSVPMSSMFQRKNLRKSGGAINSQTSVFSSQIAAAACIWDNTQLESMCAAVTGCSLSSSPSQSSPASGPSPRQSFASNLGFPFFGSSPQAPARSPEPLSGRLSKLLEQFQESIDLGALTTSQQRCDSFLEILQLDSRPWYQVWKDQDLTERVRNKERQRVEKLLEQETVPGQRVQNIDFECSIMRIKHSLVYVPFYIFFYPIEDTPYLSIVDAAQGSVFAERPFGLGSLSSIFSSFVRL